MFKVVFNSMEVITPSYNDAMATGRRLVESSYYENGDCAYVYKDNALLGIFSYDNPQVSFKSTLDNSN